MTVDAGLRAGALDEAGIILKDRRTRRGGHDDRFAWTRFAMLEEARHIPAE